MSLVSPHPLATDQLAASQLAAEAGRSDAHAHPHGASSARFGGVSLLRLSALERLAGVAVILALLWALVVWAIH